MRERELERVMRDFHQQRFNLLLCTTIIETGIDIPTANTIIINRADKFGLAQLHQLRGRVGRSHHQAYAYLLIHAEDALTAQAKKRLEAIQMMEELGSGFFLAMHDLEIRGAGEVLGESQRGEMQEIGFNLYTDMLNHAVRSLKAGKEPDLIAAARRSPPKSTCTCRRCCPNDYCSDVHERLTLYKRLANCETAGRARRDAGGTDRPLRPGARTGAGADRVAPPAHCRARAGRGAHRRRTAMRSSCSSSTSRR